MSESSSKASKNIKNFNLESQEHSKQIQPSHLSRSQSSLELSSKVSINTKRLQISEALRMQASKALKTIYYKSSMTKNIHPNHSSKYQSSTGVKFQSLQKIQRLWSIEASSDSISKAPKNFHNKSSKINKIWRTTKNTKNAKHKKSLTSTQPEIHHNFIPKIFQSIFQSKWRTSCVWVKTTSTQYLNWRHF